MRVLGETIENLVKEISQAVWGLPTVAILGFVGLLYTLRSRFFQFRRFGTVWKNTFGSLFKRGSRAESQSAFKAMATALGGTIGIGNIAGVATAIVAGGPGAVFWMWISGFIGMMTKLAEVCLAVTYRRTGPDGTHYGGPMYYMLDSMGKRFKPLSVLFACFCLLASFGIGSMTQTNSVASSLYDNFGLPPVLVGLLIAGLVLLVVCGGIKRISNFTGVFVPFMAIFYLLFALWVLLVNRAYLPKALSSIFKSAFGLQPAVGGAAGFAVSRAVSVGVSRGVFTNEAGMGSAPIAHASSDVKDPLSQGMWGVVEVFLDTIVVCTVTALVILTSGVYRGGTALDGVALTTAAFQEVFGSFGGKFVAVSVTLFAFATILGWSYYGEAALQFLTGERRWPSYVYKAVFSGSIMVGALAELGLVWNLADIFNGLMILPNVLALVLLYPVVVDQIDQMDGRLPKKGRIRRFPKRWGGDLPD
ncbi:MAG: alanine:cation symporter family protein [Clostridiales bacterium]|nr:alanine:cation symporter family protein [Clostridiales bacterium]